MEIDRRVYVGVGVGVAVNGIVNVISTTDPTSSNYTILTSSTSTITKSA